MIFGHTKDDFAVQMKMWSLLIGPLCIEVLLMKSFQFKHFSGIIWLVHLETRPVKRLEAMLFVKNKRCQYSLHCKKYVNMSVTKSWFKKYLSQVIIDSAIALAVLSLCHLHVYFEKWLRNWVCKYCRTRKHEEEDLVWNLFSEKQFKYSQKNKLRILQL